MYIIMQPRSIWLDQPGLTENNIPRANGAERRSGRKPGARVTNFALAFTYIRIMRSYIAQWHSRIKSRPPFWIWTLDGFRCFAHARVSSS